MPAPLALSSAEPCVAVALHLAHALQHTASDNADEYTSCACCIAETHAVTAPDEQQR